MRAIKSISIPEPCSQPWEQMNMVDGGRHCEHCCKTVVDFAGMTVDEIINYLSTVKNVCGRFDNGQLSAINLSFSIAKPERRIWKYFRIAMVVMGLFSAVRSEAQIRKITHSTGTKRLGKKRDSAIRPVKPDLLFAKSLTANNINIDTRTTGIPVADVDVNISKPLTGIVGGVVTGIPVAKDGWRNSYLSWRALFKY